MVCEAIDYAREHGCEYEIVVVDDGSRDDTGAVAHDMAGKDGNIRLIRHRENRGHGAALLTGLINAKKDVVVYTDADQQFTVKDLDQLLPLLENHDVVVGFRNRRGDPAYRVFISRLYNVIVRRTLGISYRDVDCGFKVFKKATLEKIGVQDLISRHYAIDAEILLRARQTGHRIVQHPVIHRPRRFGRSSGSLLRAARTLAELIRVRKKWGTINQIHGQKHPEKIS